MHTASFSQTLSRKNAWTVFLIGTGVAALVASLAAFHATPLARLDDASLDALLAASTSRRPASNTIAIDIDDVSLSAVGQWPWPRYRVAALVDKLAAARPATIALDILLPEDDRSSLANLRKTFKHDFGLDIAFTGVPDGLEDNDGFLGQEIARADVVGASYLYFDHVTTAPSRGPGLTFDGRTDLLVLDDAPGLLSNAAPIAERTRTTGFVNMRDEDGVLRRLPLLIRHAGTIHPSLALAAAMHAAGVSSATIESGFNGLTLKVGPHRVPIDRAGTATLRLSGGARRYAGLSALDVLNGHFRPEELRGKTVFIGTSAVGLNDMHNTAVDPHFPGLKIQSAMVENILQDDAVRIPDWAPKAIVAACLVVGALMAGMFASGSGVLAFTLGSALLAAVLTLGSVALFTCVGLFVSAGSPVIVVAVSFVALFMARFAIEKRRANDWLRQLENARQITIESMASVAETRDPETGAHIKRTQNYVRAIARELVRSGHYVETLTNDYVELLYISAPLHDIGKVGVPDHILLKPGRLTVDEMEIMKQHAEFGRKIIVSTAQHIDGDNFLVIAGEIAATHHERWDGGGYPAGLVGQAIPLSGRIMAVADIYDALISRRCYKEPYTHEHSTRIMRDLRGKTFDPEVIDAFFRIETEILDIATRFRDEDEGSKAAALAVPVACELPAEEPVSA
jgi:HD-GYP domain-containing protein (c-di-GMP phosphodiesterase class II)/CHASE2 domain-containing sensor protein